MQSSQIGSVGEGLTTVIAANRDAQQTLPHFGPKCNAQRQINELTSASTHKHSHPHSQNKSPHPPPSAKKTPFQSPSSSARPQPCRHKRNPQTPHRSSAIHPRSYRSRQFSSHHPSRKSTQSSAPSNQSNKAVPDGNPNTIHPPPAPAKKT